MPGLGRSLVVEWAVARERLTMALGALLDVAHRDVKLPMKNAAIVTGLLL